MVTYKRTFGARAIGVRCESCYTNHSNSVHDRREPRQVEAVETFSDQRTNTPRVALLLLCIFCIFAIICFGVVYVVGDLAKYQEAISAKESQTALLGVNNPEQLEQALTQFPANNILKLVALANRESMQIDAATQRLLNEAEPSGLSKPIDLGSSSRSDLDALLAEI
jgi:hypothetical protein